MRRARRTPESTATAPAGPRLAALALTTLALVLALALVAATGASALGDANEPSCPAGTEQASGFRAYLPDCRAYELVTPPYKEGFAAPLDSLSPDGQRVTVRSFGAFAGGGGSSGTANNLYELARTPAGWETSALDPAAAEFPGSDFRASSSDLTRAVWELHSAAQPTTTHDLSIREADGAFVEIGPELPPAASSGGQPGEGFEHEPIRSVEASPDLSHVVFSVTTAEGLGNLWPGDLTTAGESLYEYVGTGNSTPALVGVRGGAGSSELVSQCGTSLGFSESNHFEEPVGEDDISANGEVVYFTAEHENGCAGSQPAVDELWARIGGSKSLDISEPVLPKGEHCAPCAGAHREGVFEGAAADGSKVFFLTAQSLLSGDEGGEGTHVDLYEAEIEGAGEAAVVGKLVQVSHDPNGAQAADVQGVVRVAANGSRVYFVAKGVLSEAPDESLRPGHQVAVAGKDNLYVYDAGTGRVAFVATLTAADSEDWLEREVPVTSETPDGRFLVFPSSAQLTPDDVSEVAESHEGLRQIFEYDAAAGEVVRVSIGSEAFHDDGNIVSPLERPVVGFSAVSDDGSGVVFASAAQLEAAVTSSAVPGCYTAYEYRSDPAAPGGSIDGGAIDRISDGTDTTTLGTRSSDEECGSFRAPRIDGSGTDIFFESGDALVAQDTDSQDDLYDARVDGGFPAPVAPAGCAGEACVNASQLTAPALALAASATSEAGGNLPPAAKPPPPKPLTRAQKLARALKACRALRNRRRRARCTSSARKRYGPPAHRSSRHAVQHPGAARVGVQR